MMPDISESETESGASSIAGPKGQVEEGPIAYDESATMCKSPFSLSAILSAIISSGKSS